LKNGAAIYSDDWAASMPLYIPVWTLKINQRVYSWD
jgi:hypothetical protein